MISLPKPNYIGRSVQKRKPLKEMPNIPIHEKYGFIIDRYLLNSKNAFKDIKTKKKPLSSFNFQDDMFSKFSDFKDFCSPSFYKSYKKSQLLFSNQQKTRFSATPSALNSAKQTYDQRARAKSVKCKGKHHSNIQTDIKVIFENDSQDEESPLKFQPKYRNENL